MSLIMVPGAGNATSGQTLAVPSSPGEQKRHRAQSHKPSVLVWLYLGPAAPLSESSLLHLVDEGPDLGIPRAPSRMAGL